MEATSTDVTIQPGRGRLLVRVIRQKETAGGIHLPENARNPKGAIKAEIVRIGPPAHSTTGEELPSHFKEGDTILIQHHVGIPVKDHILRTDDEFRIMLERDALASVE